MDAATPQLSIIIPVYNGARIMDECLKAVQASNFRSFEVIIVDDHSTDGSAAVASRHPCRLIRLNRNQGPAAARNAGAAIAQAPVLLFLDADVIIPPSFLGDVAARFAARPELSAMFCSFGKETLPSNACSRYKNLVHHWTHQGSSREAATFCGGFGLVRTDVFFEAGGFDIRYRYLEDIDFGYRLHLDGHLIELAKDLQVTHAKHYTLPSLIKSELYGRAIPWTRLMIRYRIFRNDLNTRVHNVLSVAVSWLLPLSAFLESRLYVFPLLVVALLWLNRSFLRFATREHGLVFGAQTAFLCWLSYAVSGLGLGLGICWGAADLFRYRNHTLPRPLARGRAARGASQ